MGAPCVFGADVDCKGRVWWVWAIDCAQEVLLKDKKKQKGQDIWECTVLCVGMKGNFVAFFFVCLFV